MIPVRNQIRDLFGGETDKITFGKLSINLGLRAKRYPIWHNIGTLGGCGLQGCCYCCCRRRLRRGRRCRRRL
jgi:hypothetical protein